MLGKNQQELKTAREAVLDAQHRGLAKSENAQQCRAQLKDAEEQLRRTVISVEKAQKKASEAGSFLEKSLEEKRLWRRGEVQSFLD